MAEAKSIALGTIKISLGLLGFALFMWTPATGKGFAIFGGLLVVVFVLAGILVKYQTKPDPPKEGMEP
jgi:drug/metabolite transporter superfamily protein YnfA